MSHVVREIAKVEIESTESITIKVVIADHKIMSIEMYELHETGHLFIPHDGSMMALLTLKGQLDTILEEAKKHVRIASLVK